MTRTLDRTELAAFDTPDAALAAIRDAQAPALLTAQVESYAATLPDLVPMFDRHYDDLSLHKGRFPLAPQYRAYLERDAAGQVLLVTLRRGGVLIGYFIGFLMPGLHYSTCLTLTMDIYWIAPEHRGGFQSGALRLFRAVEREARRRGVNHWCVSSKWHKDTGRLFRALGFQQIEVSYSKWLEG